MTRLRILAVLLAGLQFAAFVTILATYDRPLGQFGYTVRNDGVTIATVEPGLPAARAGIIAGDRIVYRTLPLPGRLNALENEWVRAQRSLDLDIVHKASIRRVTMAAQELPHLYASAQLAFAFAGAILAAVGLLLVTLRPCRMTWAFALISPPLLLPDALMVWAQSATRPLGFGYQLAVAVLYALQAAGITMFAARFPSDTPQGLNRVIDRLAIPLAVALGLLYVYVDIAIFFQATPPASAALVGQNYVGPLIAALAAVVAFLFTYVSSQGSTRSRLLPTLLTFIMLVAAATVQAIEVIATSNPTLMLLAYFSFAGATVLFATAVLYGVLRHRVIDVNFILSRTLVYTVLTLFAVSVLSLIEFYFGKILERGGVAMALEIVAAMAIGLSFNALHKRVDGFIDVVLFRRRHLAEERLTRIAEELPLSSSQAAVNAMLTREPFEALDLVSAAAFVRRKETSEYDRATAMGWSDEQSRLLAADDPLVVEMRAGVTAIALPDRRGPRIDFPAGIAQPVYAVPIAVGRRLEAIALYGGHPGGQDLDPDERRALRKLARAAALAYDNLALQDLQRTIDALRRENAALRRVPS